MVFGFGSGVPAQGPSDTFSGSQAGLFMSTNTVWLQAQCAWPWWLPSCHCPNRPFSANHIPPFRCKSLNLER